MYADVLVKHLSSFGLIWFVKMRLYKAKPADAVFGERRAFVLEALPKKPYLFNLFCREL